ncbi:addiction module toxin, Txe/YoeB family [Treponema primitia ZAS-2]|uniref:Putative mRNA interferase YoeB n=1 Tax=Treponema primitia (strain ATCC BAA-887 / DSM 12427 / ZAS-2) TaxID=545694 RepID=F5YRB3_TREPZ|nr:Txe/YoeB family addiction module toxin [Treponema primitia]AEF84260.1 addiction module toxin, Txe/YoeB family [Treponema primitia ZAS-2]
MDDLIFAPDAFKQYTEWQTEDKKILKRINELIRDIRRNGLLKGIGKPEALKHRKAYSRRIDDANRLIYTGDENRNLKILSCKGHYED